MLKTKIILIITFLAVSFLSTCFFAQLNYNSAMSAAKDSEGTDSAIEQAIGKYGYNADSLQDITMTDKLAALFNVATN